MKHDDVLIYAGSVPGVETDLCRGACGRTFLVLELYNEERHCYDCLLESFARCRELIDAYRSGAGNTEEEERRTA